MTTINSIEEFLTQLEKDHESNDGELWFRGQPAPGEKDLS